MRARILFVESTPDVGRAVTSVLETNHFEVIRAGDDRQAVERLGAERFDLLVVEVKATADDSGLRFLRHVNTAASHLTPRIVVISSEPSLPCSESSTRSESATCCSSLYTRRRSSRLSKSVSTEHPRRFIDRVPQWNGEDPRGE